MKIQRHPTYFKPPADRYRECTAEVGVNHLTTDMRISFRFQDGGEKSPRRIRVELSAKEAIELCESIARMAHLAVTRPDEAVK